MSFLRPEPMVKFTLIGLKDDEERVVTALHDLGVVQVEPIGADALQHLEPERGAADSRAIGDELLRFRTLLRALPPTPTQGSLRTFRSTDEILAAARSVTIDDEVGGLKREEDALTTERKSIDDDVGLLERFSFYSEPFEALQSRSVLAFFGEAPSDVYPDLAAALGKLPDLHLETASVGKDVRFLLVVRAKEGETVSRLAQQEGVRLTAAPRLEGTRAEALPKLTKRRSEVDARLAEIDARLRAISEQWYATAATLEEALSIEAKKADATARFGGSARVFALEGWAPRKSFPEVEHAVRAATGDRVHLQELATNEEPPTLMSNPKGVRRYEFFIRFYSLPQASEWDPTWVFAVVFPILFGFMLGDWGYGLTILLISVWMIRGFPGGAYLPKSIKNFVKNIMGPKGMQSLAYALLPGCAIAIGLGLYFDEFFGFHVLHSVLGYVGPDPASGTTVAHLLVLAGYIGLAMVVFGFSLGAVKEYFHHHRKGAVGKVGGILFALGLVTFGLQFLHGTTGSPVALVGVGVLAVGAVLFFLAEGVQTAMIELLETLSHILSYTRLVGILLASVILALVINTVATGLFGQSSSAAGVVFVIGGLVILLVGQVFNVILGVFEPGIQGARLIFVEYFSKFYTGSGRPFAPLASARQYTAAAPLPSAPGAPSPPAAAPAP